MPDVSGASAVNTGVHTQLTMRTPGCGCIGHPAFPAPSLQRAKRFQTKLGRGLRREIAKSYVKVSYVKAPLLTPCCLKFESGTGREAPAHGGGASYPFP